MCHKEVYCLIIPVIVEDFMHLVGLHGNLEIYKAARVFLIFKDMMLSTSSVLISKNI